MLIERLTRPVTPAVPLADARDFLRVTHVEDDALIAAMVRAAGRELEDYASLALLTQTVRVTLAAWPLTDALFLPVVPMLDAGTLAVTAGGAAFTDFTATTGNRPALVLTGDAPTGQVVVQYAAGWAAVPADLAQAVMAQVTVAYDLRGLGERVGPAVSPHFARVAGRYRRVAL